MKTIKLEKTEIPENLVKFQGDSTKTATYKELIVLALDIVPQGGFTASDIRERSRIQDALDEAKNGVLELEDSDYNALEKIMKNSRWPFRSKELHTLLQNFEDGVYKKEQKK
jgi:hypothetical protein